VAEAAVAPSSKAVKTGL